MPSPAPTLDATNAGFIKLGNDLRVPRLGLGAMRITGEGVWGDPPDRGAAHEVLRTAVRLGIRFIDTADSYGPEVSERLIAEALYPYPPDLVIATKGGIVRPDKPTWARDARPQHLRQACEASLQRLRLERIDLYQLHALDPAVPLEDSIGELARLRHEGKIRHVGVSNFSVQELERAQRIVPIVSVQNRFNVADRGSDAVLRACERRGLAFIPWSPLVQGAADSRNEARRRLESEAADRGWSLPQAAIAWLLAHSPAMLPIPGTSRADHLEQLVAAASFSLDG
jgi:aryl-alcohol dehydrogenase-like predicted oxidoreductase